MNVGENKGRRLRVALSRFAAMLIEEARDITGLTFAQLDEELGLPDGQSYRYSLYPIREKTRSPQATGIQQLENRVAKLLKRSAHTIVVENNAKINANLADGIEGRPSDGLNLRKFDALDFQLGYDGDWPTYRRLKYDRAWLQGHVCINDLIKRAAHHEWPELLRLYSWQWGVLWDKGLPWLSREALGVRPDISIESFLPSLTIKAKKERMLVPFLAKTANGQNLLIALENALQFGYDESVLDEIVEEVMFTAAATKKYSEICGLDVSTGR